MPAPRPGRPAVALEHRDHFAAAAGSDARVRCAVISGTSTLPACHNSRDVPRREDVKKLSLGACAGVLLLPVMASAEAPAGQIAVYLANPIIEYGNTYSNSGTGFGVRGWGMLNPSWSLHGEYQSTEAEDDKVTVASL